MYFAMAFDNINHNKSCLYAIMQGELHCTCTEQQTVYTSQLCNYVLLLRSETNNILCQMVSKYDTWSYI